jgi:UDP-N-acetylglucosamine pyrophosphorylase
MLPVEAVTDDEFSERGRTGLRVAIMAAGKGTRMNDPEKPKVLFTIDGRPMIHYVLDRALALRPESVIVIIGHRANDVRAAVMQEYANEPVRFALQDPQHGTAHAIMQAVPEIVGFEGELLVLSGDVPLLSLETLDRLIDHHRSSRSSATVLTVEAPDPTGYGRVVRDDSGAITSIVEHKDADDAARSIREINSGVYVFAVPDLLDALPRVTNDNAQGEYYLPDVVAHLLADGKSVSGFSIDAFDQIQGVNTREQLDALQGRVKAVV